MKNRSQKTSFDISQYYPLFFTIIFIVVLFQYSFTFLEAIFYDLRVKYDFGTSFKDNIVIVTLDEESDEFLGEDYPYTYASHWRMVSRLFKDRPKIINYYVNLLDHGSPQDLAHSERFKDRVKDFVKKGGKFRFATELGIWGESKPPKNLQSLGYSLSIIKRDGGDTFSKDDVTRRALLYVSGDPTLDLWTANEYRKFKGKKTLDSTSILGSYYHRDADASFVLFRYYTSPLDQKSRIKTIPFHRVLVGNFPKGFFTDKIVLIGPTYLANSENRVLTPFNKDEYKSSKLAIHAQILQALINNKTVFQIPLSVSFVVAMLLSFFLSLTISRIKPTHGLFITVLSIVSIFLIAYLIFCIFGFWLYITHLILTVFVVYYIWVPFRAIGEYQRRYAIQEEAKLLKHVENLKQNFISLMSHDLKTPVAKIAGMADVLSIRFRDNLELKKGLQSIIESTKELNKFITSILDLTKIESRNLNLNKTQKDVNTILEGVIENYRFEASHKSITFEKDLAPLYPIEVDVNLINRVLSNLIENAIKYSGEASTISIRTHDDTQWVYIEIKDNGVGIPEDDLKHIFDKFYRVKNDASHSIKGTGLGLYLVKYFVELHGGEIEAESAVGEGTTFHVRLVNA